MGLLKAPCVPARCHPRGAHLCELGLESRPEPPTRLAPRRGGFGRSFGSYLIPPVPIQRAQAPNPGCYEVLGFSPDEAESFYRPPDGELGLLAVGVRIAQSVAGRVGGVPPL